MSDKPQYDTGDGLVELSGAAELLAKWMPDGHEIRFGKANIQIWRLPRGDEPAVLLHDLSFKEHQQLHVYRTWDGDARSRIDVDLPDERTDA